MDIVNTAGLYMNKKTFLLGPGFFLDVNDSWKNECNVK